jgi:class 3 adenylate cyclase/pimeloyl-ACP methyl ester carboxylesterase
MDVPTTHYVKTEDGVHIGYQVFGEGGYDLVLNDGWMSNVDANWDMPSYAAYLRALSRRARVIMFDRRGFGVSDRPTSPEAMALEKGMDDARAVMDAVGSTRAVVCGFESGGAVSILFAASFPERTLGLVLMAPMVSYWKAPDFTWGLTESYAREWDERIERSWGTAEFWKWHLEDVDIVADDEHLRSWARWSRLCASPQAALAIEQVERQIDVRALLPQIHIPTLVMLKASDRDHRLWGAAPWVAEQIPGGRYVELPGGGHFPEAGGEMYFEELDRFVSQIHAQEAEFDRVLATVLFTDIASSTDTAVAIGDRAWSDLVERHHGIVRAMIARYRGEEVDTAGDGFFATFDGPARGVRCAQQIVQAVRSLGLEVRAGVHTGEVQTIDGKAGGLGVVIGARVGAKAGPSEVLVSQTVKHLTAGSGLVLEDAGEHELKGVPDRWRLYRVGTDTVAGVPSR